MRISIYFNDPDGNTIELYTDASDVWKQRPEAVAQVTPIDLELAIFRKSAMRHSVRGFRHSPD